MLTYLQCKVLFISATPSLVKSSHKYNLIEHLFRHLNYENHEVYITVYILTNAFHSTMAKSKSSTSTAKKVRVSCLSCLCQYCITVWDHSHNTWEWSKHNGCNICAIWIPSYQWGQWWLKSCNAQFLKPLFSYHSWTGNYPNCQGKKNPFIWQRIIRYVEYVEYFKVEESNAIKQRLASYLFSYSTMPNGITGQMPAEDEVRLMHL